MRGDDEHQTAHTPIALMLCSKLENLATMPRRAQAQHKCEDNIILGRRFRSVVRLTGRPQRPWLRPRVHEPVSWSSFYVRRDVSISWAISWTRVENSSAGCIPESRVIFPPWERPFAGAIRSEKLSSTVCASTNLNRRSRYPLTSPLTSVSVGSSLPSV